jgi:ubiquitin C-terminal hydrolase
MWGPNARVQVYVRSTDFDSEQMPYLLAALQNWNHVSEQTESGVKFEFQGYTAQQRSCENCLTILRDRVFDKTKRHATELRAYSARDNRIITSASIIVDPVLTNPKAILNALVHELGHNLGLLDCYTCKRKSTVMNQFKALNVSNDMETPTLCDVAQVRQAYKDLKVRNSALVRKLIPEDEGEEPVEDDTPVVVPTGTVPLSDASVIKRPSRPD